MLKRAHWTEITAHSAQKGSQRLNENRRGLLWLKMPFWTLVLTEAQMGSQEIKKGSLKIKDPQ